MRSDRTTDALELMAQFADRTGLTSDRPRQRYLWTDAFAVCTLLGLERATGNERLRGMALRLVDQVHHELGCHRADDRRTGWLSGLPESEAEQHPTRGGLRIGKPLRERAAGEPLDSTLEWDRDGQYFHYLTRWMHALDQATRSTGRPTFNVWGRELTETAHHAFTYGPRGARRMVWKLSVDLSRALVPSMGHHDPLDGLVACTQLESTAAQLQIAAGPQLALARADFAQMLDPAGLVTSDPLGLGGLLIDACLLSQLEHADEELVVALLTAASFGLHHYLTEPDLRAPAEHRIAFRELGLAIGLAGLSMLDHDVAGLSRYLPLRAEIESFWLRPEHRRSVTWLDHANINDVMLATSLAPEGFLVLAPTRVSPDAPAPRLHP